MEHSGSICFICLNTNTNLRPVLQNNKQDDTAVQVKFVLPELTIWDSIYICSLCCTSLESFYTFKKNCTQNYNHLMNKKTSLESNAIQIKTRSKEMKKQEVKMELNTTEEIEDSEEDSYQQPEFVKCEIMSDCDDNSNSDDKSNSDTNPFDMSKSCQTRGKEIVDQATTAANNVLPAKSAKSYEKFYEQFMEWSKKNKMSNVSENVLIVYFEELSSKLKSTTLWTHYSILKSMLSIRHTVDITKYSKLHALLKRKSEGYQPKKSNTFSTNEIKQFIGEAPDVKYLVSKVACIFGIMGACRRHELHKMELKDVNDFGSTLLVIIKDTKTKKTRKFTVTGKYYEICKKYMNLRPKDCITPSFFLNYMNGKCTVQNVGINKFGNMGKEIATYLNLPNPNLYTGHCFRRSSATIVVDAGGDITALKRHGRWKTTTVAENCIEESVQNQVNVADQMLNPIEFNQTNNSVKSTPTTSTMASTHVATKQLEVPQFHFNDYTM